MIDPHLVWEALLVDARACPVAGATAGDPFALPAQEQGQSNKRSSCRELFTFITAEYQPSREQTKEQTNTMGANGRAGAGKEDHKYETERIYRLSKL
jgi:hypothetical protein